MEETAKTESHLSSAAAFVEGGIQDACDDACSICLEAFSESDPSTVTSCKHEFHLQCILEWCQRSPQCPMCWQPISFKDSISQDLLSDVESERNIRLNRTRNSTIFNHPSLVDLDLENIPVGGTDAELEERIFQHLAAAAAMGRAHHISRREGQRSLSGSHGRPQYFIFSAHPDATSLGSVSSSTVPPGESELGPVIVAGSQSASQTIHEEDSASQDLHALPTNADLSSGMNSSSVRTTPSRTPAGQTTPVNRDRPGPSDIQSFSESLKSRLNAVSLRYKESITKSTRGWREKLFSRNSSVADLGSEVKREVNATVSRMMERLESREHQRSTDSSPSRAAVTCPSEEPIDEGPPQIQNSATSKPNDITPSTSHLASSSAS